MEVGISEMLVIALVIVVLFGPDKLPQIARDLGQGVRKMRGAVEDIKTEIMKETDNPVSEIKKEIEKVKESVKEVNPMNQLNSETLINKTEKTEIAEPEKPKPQDDEAYEGPISR